MSARPVSRAASAASSPPPAAPPRTASPSCAAQGKDIVNLAIGEPDFDTPEHIRRAALRSHRARRDALHAGRRHARAAPGDRRQAAARERPELRARATSSSPAAPSTRSSTRCRSRVEAGDEVIMPAPYWVSYPDMVLACDGTPVIVPCREEDGFRLTPAALEAAITPATRWLVFNSPTNPTGTTYTRGAAARSGRRAAAPSAGDGADRRHLRAHPLRRRGDPAHRWRSSPRCASARWWSTASRRPTR